MRSRASCSPSCSSCCSAAARFWNLFPFRGLTSDNFADLSWPEKVLDYLWHITLPVSPLVLGKPFATSTLLTKNSFLDEIKKAYVQTARMKGLTERRVLYGHVFRNAMLIVIANFPAPNRRRLLHRIAAHRAGLLARRPRAISRFDSLMNRDYPVVLGNLYVFALIGLIPVNLSFPTSPIPGSIRASISRKTREVLKLGRDDRIRARGRASWKLGPMNRLRLDNATPQPARALVVLDLRSSGSSSRCSPEFVANDSADRLLQGGDSFPGPLQL